MNLVTTETELRDLLRSLRGRESDRHGDCDVTLKDMAIRSGIPIGTMSKVEASPNNVSLQTLCAVMAAHGKKIILIIEDE